MSYKGPLLLAVILFFGAGFSFNFVVVGLISEDTGYPLGAMLDTAALLAIGVGFFRSLVKMVDARDANP
ncbi:hypothetical protein BIY27_12090 [Gibbsiella quercinecans]|uniref:hypothetical protein n=1 Tax=Gibbsiella quercinecans TaxID=929813 RepID=UPI000EF19EB2|nr:hypothetical protein [Gibbsiella quercinecans]RLM11773.1 hypothetical protein BIY27_12090 [Gibbsiella quercinecans]